MTTPCIQGTAFASMGPRAGPLGASIAYAKARKKPARRDRQGSVRGDLAALHLDRGGAGRRRGARPPGDAAGRRARPVGEARAAEHREMDPRALEAPRVAAPGRAE